MITQKDNITFVCFAYAGDPYGTIGVSVKATKLSLQELQIKKNVGDTLNPDEIKTLPAIELHFSNEKSIDVMIKALEAIRRNIQREFAYALAC